MHESLDQSFSLAPWWNTFILSWQGTLILSVHSQLVTTDVCEYWETWTDWYRPKILKVYREDCVLWQISNFNKCNSCRSIKRLGNSSMQYCMSSFHHWFCHHHDLPCTPDYEHKASNEIYTNKQPNMGMHGNTKFSITTPQRAHFARHLMQNMQKSQLESDMIGSDMCNTRHWVASEVARERRGWERNKKNTYFSLMVILAWSPIGQNLKS